MDQRTWLWRKKSSEKTILANGDEVRIVATEKEVDLENCLKILEEKLASVADECSAKDELVQNYKKTAEDVAADKQKSTEGIQRLKEELREVQQQRVAANERLVDLNSALKDCMEQLNLVRQEQEQRMRDAVMKTSKEFEKSHKKLEEKLSELTAESSYLRKALVVKEKLIEELNIVKSRTESEFEALMTRLDTVEKENAFLRYEFRSLEKELDFRNEEMEYLRRSEETLQKQNLENVKKIKKSETDCQRLRALTRKRLPGPAILANIQRDIEVQGRNQINTRRNGINAGTNDQLSFLIDQVKILENENKIFRECLAKKEEEIFYLRKVEKSESTMSNLAPDELSLSSGYGIDDSKESCSQAIALVSDLQIKSECKMIGATELSLMDDFVEMEKLAIVTVDSPLGASFNASDATKELVPVGNSDFSDMENAKDTCFKKPNDWLQDVGKIILEQHNASKRSFHELLGDIRMSLQSEESKLLPISGYITWKSPTSSPSSSLIQESNTEHHQSDLNGSITKMIELIGRFNSSHSEDHNMQGNFLTDYEIHVFRWKRSELAIILQEFVHSCYNLLDWKINIEKFTVDLTSILGWIIDNCISNQDHSAFRDESSFVKSSDEAFDDNLRSQKNEDLLHKLLQSQEIIASLRNEIEILKESKGITEDHVENLNLTNEDLDTQLSVTRAKLNEVQHKLSSIEVELENKSHCCEELEGTCLELQLQLESVTSNRYQENNENQEGLLQTGLEITRASVKLAECEETILKLGKQLKALGSAEELSVVDKVLSNTKNKKLKQRSSLRDQMLCEDSEEVKNQESPMTKEIISTTEANVPHTSSCNAFSFPDGQVATPTVYLGMKNESRNANAGALVIVPSKTRGGGIGILRKLLLRRKKSSSKKTTIYFGK